MSVMPYEEIQRRMRASLAVSRTPRDCANVLNGFVQRYGNGTLGQGPYVAAWRGRNRLSTLMLRQLYNEGAAACASKMNVGASRRSTAQYSAEGLLRSGVMQQQFDLTGGRSAPAPARRVPSAASGGDLNLDAFGQRGPAPPPPPPPPVPGYVPGLDILPGGGRQEEELPDWPDEGDGGLVPDEGGALPPPDWDNAEDESEPGVPGWVWVAGLAGLGVIGYLVWRKK